MILSTWLMAAGIGSAQSLEEVRALADTGARDLALGVMDTRQKQMQPGSAPWVRWERERVEIHRQEQDWTAISRRLASLPEEVEVDFRLWAATQRANALLELGQGREARRSLRQVLWTYGELPAAAAYLAHWQRLILRSYIRDGLADDAQTAAMRYRQEHGWSEDVADLRLQARILLMNRRAGEAVRLLSPHVSDPQIHALYLLAQLRSTQAEAGEVLGASVKQLRVTKSQPEQQIYFWAVAAEAARMVGDRGTVANAMEHLLVGREHLALASDLIHVDADQLWKAYIEHATHLGNKTHLLIGQDAQWLTYADEIAPRLPVSARAIYAFVLSHAGDTEHRSSAAKAYARLALKRDRGEELLHRVFLEGSDFAQRRNIPVPIRHALVDIALGRSDLPLASELMATIDEPPPGSDNFMWHLRRARILVLGGNVEQSGQALHAILDANEALGAQQRDRYLQVVFDLQSADAHDTAVALFQRVMKITEDEKIQRELFYWMAESRKAQGRYAEAARLYLQSAMHPDPKNMDPWAQTAHYQAAETLAKGGFVRDARNLFQRLLKVTDDASRRAVLKRELQKLWLVQDKTHAAETKEEL